MTVNIRPVCDADIDVLVELTLLAWTPIFESVRQILGPEIYAILYPDWQKVWIREVEVACRNGDKISVWVADIDGRAVGFIAYILNNDNKMGSVHLVGVHPEYQNQGIGTELNNFALEKMREGGMTLAFVDTGGDPSHAPARRSYEKAGYIGWPLVHYYQVL